MAARLRRAPRRIRFGTGQADSRQAIASKLCAALALPRRLRMDTPAPELIVLSRCELAALVPFADYVAAVTDAFRLQAEGRAVLPPPLEISAEAGSFHVKAGRLPLGRGYAAVKINSN